MQENTTDPGYHVQNIKRMLDETKTHIRDDIAKVEDPQALALFEVTAEVLGGLIKAYEHYEQKSEKAWKKGG